MRRAFAGLATSAVLIVVAAPAPSSAQIFISDQGGSSHARVTSALIAEVRVSGSVTVDFHGDPGSGCEERRLCGVTGAVTWNPARSGELIAYGLQEGAVRSETSILILDGSGVDHSGASTSATVRRAATEGTPAGLCVDAGGNSSFVAAVGPQTGTAVPISLTGEPETGFTTADSFRTRCAGPTASDLSALLPTRVVSPRALRRGHRNVDFSAERDFASHGLAGTLHSTVAIRIRKVNDSGGGGGFALTDKTSPTLHGPRIRSLTASYRIERVSGQVVTDVGALTDPDLCGPLDACGLLGTVTVAPQASSGELTLSALAPARHSAADLRRALGLQAGPDPQGVGTTGYGDWKDTGDVSSAFTRLGVRDCSDSEPLLGGTVTLGFGRRRVFAAYGGGSDLGGGDLVRTRCPGPGSADVTADRALATGSLPKSALRRRTVTLRLTRGGAFSSDGYSGATRPDVTIVLRRTHIRQQTFAEPGSVPRVAAAFRRALR